MICFVSEDFWLVSMAAVGALGGVALFFRGFRMLQYKRLILNTPFSKIRSASIGLVEVSGMPTGPQTIAAAITGEPCYYYRARAWQWVRSGSDKKWEQVLDESSSVPFFLEDSTGKVLISPQGADLDVHRNFTDELQTSRFGQGSLIPDSIRKFVAQRGLLSGDKIRLEERIIKPGHPLFVYGTLGEKPGRTSWTPTWHAPSARPSFGFGVKFSLGESGSDVTMKMMGDMVPRSSADKSVVFETRTTTGGPIVLPDRVVEELNRIGVPLPVSVLPESSPLARNAGGPVATKIAADARGALAVATAEKQSNRGATAESGFDLDPRVAIGKGARGDPFTISSESQREVVQSLAWKSMLYIWGSPVFTLVCVYFLVVYWGWL
jgi:hypothetical protein